MAASTLASATLDPNGAASLASAHARLLRDHSYQFSFAAPEPREPPQWLAALAKALIKLAPYLSWALWCLLVLGVVAIIALLAREFILYRRPGRIGSKRAAMDLETWRPSAAHAKALLADADRLAGEGRYGEAAHVLLSRSIEDIEEKRPRLVEIAHTSRDIAVLGELPESARQALGVIVRHVERSLFGGRLLDAKAFADCRRAYEAFAFPGQWTSR